MLLFNSIGDVWGQAKELLLRPPSGPALNDWPTFQHYLNGLRPHELTLLCAPTGSGKTALLANISRQLLEQGVSHFVAPVETGDVDYTLRTFSSLILRDLCSSEAMSERDLESAEAQIGEKLDKPLIRGLKNAPLYISPIDNRVSVDEMIATLQYMHDTKGCVVALLDNLNFFLPVSSASMEKADMDNAIHEFVILAKRIPMHIILIVHPRKTQDGRVESEFDIKGSSTAVQEASNVILFNRPTQEDLDKRTRQLNERELVFKKIRKRGMFVGKPIWFRFENGKYIEQEVPKKLPFGEKTYAVKYTRSND